MEQHPVPQHIASFEFKLFGNLTIRQFVTLSIPMSLAALVFFSSLPGIIRLPLSLVIALIALFAALVPINGRPLDKWLVSFIKAVMSPTQRIWVKEPKIPEFLNIVTSHTPSDEKIPETITAQGRERLKAYLRSLPKGSFTPLDVKEQIAVERLGLEPAHVAMGQNLEGAPGSLPPPIIWPTSPISKSFPQITSSQNLSMAQSPAGSAYQEPMTDREYQGAMEASLPPESQTRTPTAPKITSHAKPYALPGLENKLQKKMGIEHIQLSPIAPLVKAQLASEANSAVENVISIRTPDRKIKLIHGIGQTRVRKLHFAPPEGFDLSKLPIRGEKRFEISEELKNRFGYDRDIFEEEKQPAPPVILPTAPAPITTQAPQTEKKHLAQAPTPSKIHYIQRPITHSATDATLKTEKREDLEAKISILGSQTPTVPLPQDTSRAQIVPLTNTPNVISGIVTDQKGNPLENTILTIKDSSGIPVRALKTNKLGQFLSATPLNDGPYTIEVESSISSFDPIGLMLRGQVMNPLQIKSKN